MSRHVRSCGLHGVPCGICSAPAQFMEIHPDGKIATVHVAMRLQDRHTVITRCWAAPGPPLPAKKVKEKPPRRSDSKAAGKSLPPPPISIAAELAQRANSPLLRRSA